MHTQLTKLFTVAGSMLSGAFLAAYLGAFLPGGLAVKAVLFLLFSALFAVSVVKKHRRFPSPAGSLRLWAVALILGGFFCLYYRKFYLPALQLQNPVLKLVFCSGAALIPAFFLQWALEWLTTHLGQPAPWQLITGTLYPMVFVILFDSHWLIVPALSTKLVLALLTAVNVYILWWGISLPRMAKYRSRSARTMIGIVSLYASLASFGQRFFLAGNTRMHLSADGVLYCFLGILWFLPVVLLGLYLLETMTASAEKRQPPLGSRRKAKRILFGCLALTQAVILWILWPGSFPRDAYTQLRNALGITQLNDWHPVLYALIMRLILNFTGDAAMIIVVQMVCVVWLLTAYLMMGYDRGIPLKLLCVLGSVFLLLPNQALSWSNAVKDYPFTLALVWGTYLLLQLACKHPWTKKWTFYLCLCMDLFLIAGLRHNGVLPFGVLGVLCIWLTIRTFSQVRFRAAGAFLVSLVALVVFKGPIYTALDVIPNIQSTYTSMLCAVGSYINKGLPLSEESQEIMETVIPMEDWADYYSRYDGHDVYYWGRPEGSVEYDTSQIDAKKAFRVYLEALFRAPDVVIKDRLDGMDILWDVVQPKDGYNANAFHYTFTYDVPLDCIPMENLAAEDGQHYYKQTALAQMYYGTTDTEDNSVFDILIWRTGAYLILLMILFLFWWKNHLSSLWMATLPLLSNGFASVLIVYHQSFRYVYFAQLMTVALVFATVVLKQELTQNPHTTLQEGATIE